jgi:DNA-binding transcriptional MerR regulator
MPYREKEIERLYYPIGEVADMLDVNTSTIRFWEREFEVLAPRKNQKGNRVYTQKDINLLKTIHHLLKVRGYTLEGARKTLKEKPDQTLKEVELAERLRRIRAALVELKDKL